MISFDTTGITETGVVSTVTLYTSGDVIHTTGIVVSLYYTGVAIDGSDFT